MDFDFSDDQEQLRDAVRRYIDKAYTFERRRGIVAAGGFERQAYIDLAELGLTGLNISDAHGGMGMGPVESLIVLQELGRGIALEPLAVTQLAGVLIEAYGDEATKARYLPGMASGQQIVVLAHQERKARYWPQKCEGNVASARMASALSAIKNVVLAGDHADAFIVPAMQDGQLALFMVERAASGVSTRGYGLQDGSRAADVTFKDAPATLLTTQGTEAMQLAQDVGIAQTCAYAIGVMEKTLDVTVDYMNTRKQFGVAIASFQALRHRVADMKMALELARSMSYYASLKLGAPADERSRACAQAKVQLGRSMRLISQEAVQLHGGIGVTDEYIVSHYFKTLTQLEMSWGDSLHHLGQASSLMQDTAGVFI
jgi:alkylation response protein AidB-like acyl-CoA dehydrogenase